MPFDSLAVANYFIQRGAGMVSAMKAQKLVYFAHGWNLAIDNQPLLNEPIEAWQYGPVVKQLYHDLKEFGSNPIPAPVTVLRGSRSSLMSSTPMIDDYAGADDIDNTKALLDRIWDVYGGYTAVKLSNATHTEGSPWDVTWKACGGAKHTIIPDSLIREDFLKRLHKANPQPQE
jgi:uncharacterized phage-associated protein